MKKENFIITLKNYKNKTWHQKDYINYRLKKEINYIERNTWAPGIYRLYVTFNGSDKIVKVVASEFGTFGEFELQELNNINKWLNK